jgi:hypothetical protein
MEKHTSRHHEEELRNEKEDNEDAETPPEDPAPDDHTDN